MAVVAEKGTVAPMTDRQKAIEVAISQIERQFGKGSIMKMSRRGQPECRSIRFPPGASRSIWRLGIGGVPRGRIVEIYGPESSGKTTLALHIIAEAQKLGRVGGDRRRRACARSALCRALGRQSRRAADFAARYRRAGAGDHRDSGPIRRARCGRDRLGGGAGAEGRDRRRHGRFPRRLAGASDEPGAAEADRRDRPIEYLRHLHQPVADEDRRDVRQSGDDDRRQRAQVLRLGADGYPPDRDA